MSLRDAAVKVAPKGNGPRCGYGKVLEKLSADDLVWIEEQYSLGKTHIFVTDVLRADGHEVSEFMVRRHRRGRCGCVAA